MSLENQENLVNSEFLYFVIFELQRNPLYKETLFNQYACQK